jgi:hypothetical protein
MCCVTTIKLHFIPSATSHSSFFDPAGMGSDSWPSYRRITVDTVQLVGWLLHEKFQYTADVLYAFNGKL